MDARNYAVLLINRMNNVDLNCENESMCMLYPHAIECALITVDEILKLDIALNIVDFLYFKKVKNEILTIKNKL